MSAGRALDLGCDDELAIAGDRYPRPQHHAAVAATHVERADAHPIAGLLVVQPAFVVLPLRRRRQPGDVDVDRVPGAGVDDRAVGRCPGAEVGRRQLDVGDRFDRPLIVVTA